MRLKTGTIFVGVNHGVFTGNTSTGDSINFEVL